MQPSNSRRTATNWVLLATLVVYLILALFTVREVGLVGEVAIGWSQPDAPTVFVNLDPPITSDGAPPQGAGHDIGPLSARQSRPIEQLHLGPITLPWAINGHTGGHADWPALLIYQMTSSIGMVRILHVLYGALLIALVHRFLVFHATTTAANIASLVLATNWSFLFYKKVLGGTEVLLQAAVLLCLWALWSRRWRAGPHGLTALGIGIGLGFGAKLSFGLSFVALCLTALIMRWDKPALRPPLPTALWKPMAAIALLTAPLWTSLVHHWLGMPESPRIRSHDFAGVQWDRILVGLDGGASTTRESFANLGYWLTDPLGFYRQAYGAQGGGTTAWQFVSWSIIGLGALLGWRDRHPTPRLALLRFCTVFLFLQTSILFWVARDLHHLAQTTPVLAIVAGLAVDQIASLMGARRSHARTRFAALFCIPIVVAGVHDLQRTDAVMRTISVPTWTVDGQESLQRMLRSADVERLVVSDYESYGLLELLCPELEVEHVWGFASRSSGDALASAILNHARGAHLLLVRPSAPMIYGWPRTSLEEPDRDLRRLIAEGRNLGIDIEEVGRLEDETALLVRLSD